MAKYETVAEIRQEETERLERARRYDALRAEWSHAARLVEKLEAQESVVKRHITSLSRVIDEANKLPEEIVHDGVAVLGGIAIPGGVSRGMLSAIASSALARVQRKNAERLATIEAAAKRRDDARAALDEEFPE